MNTDNIIIQGARQHNLKNISLEIPRQKLTVITGLSGSGKSSLAFDTLFAEGQRRYVESLSAYARQFLERMEKPDVDFIDGLSPAIAIEQKTASHNPRSTVGTVTEIYDYLRLLFTRIGTPHCHQCSRPITSQSIDQIVDQVLSLDNGTRIMIMAPMVSDSTGSHDRLIKKLRREGFARLSVNGDIFEIEKIPKLNVRQKHSIEVVVDRLILKTGIRKRLADSLELALSMSRGLVVVQPLDGTSLSFSEKAACLRCGTQYPEFTPAHFSFNSPLGACPKCDGLGLTTEFDPDLIVPDQNLSIREGAILPWQNRNSVRFFEFIDALTDHYRVDIYTPFKDLPATFKEVLFYGSGNQEISFYFEKNDRRYDFSKPFEGIIPNLQKRYLETDSSRTREEIKSYITHRVCPECNGDRLNLPSRSVIVKNETISSITRLSVTRAISFFHDLHLSGKQQIIADRIIREIQERLGFLERVGIGYLTLDRSAQTLSGGESQRIRLATQIGSRLTGVMYVLDEPSIGLHQRDNRQLIRTLQAIRDQGNTVLVVEHDEETILSADFVVDMGPRAGIQGGEVVFSGSPALLLTDPDSLTGHYLSGKKEIQVPTSRRPGNGHQITISGACENNLQGIRADFPLGCLICVTGVSGSGKSTLVLDTLYRAVAYHLNGASSAGSGSRNKPGCHETISGLSHIDKVVNIDQSPIGRTPRSNPGTYTGLFTHIRELMARTPEARLRGYRPGRFSFNVKGGRCESCRGDGIIKIEMHFLPDIYVTCDICNGKRYNRESLEIRYKGVNIADILDMTVNQALSFFKSVGKIRQKLETLVDVGLGYIKIGQPATTLSGGEAQRIKLSRELSKKDTGRTLYILDEPTTGLHAEDIKRLLAVLDRLVELGNTVVVIEHNLDVVKTADTVIDLGPEGGDGGGWLVACGTPEDISACTDSYTGQYLKKVLERGSG